MLCPLEATLEEVPTQFQCNADKKSDRIRLYLGLKNLKISCYLQNDYSNSENQDIFSTLYTSKGLAPSLKLYNRTHAVVFNFQMSLNTTTWSIDIPRNHITLNADVAPVDEWYLQFKMHHGLDIFSTEGTLLDTVREPLLQWTIGTPISYSEVGTFINNAVNLQVSKSPCSNDVAILAPIFAPQTSAGCVTLSFIFVFTPIKISCLLCVSDCNGLAVADITLTSFNLLILTTRGLFISEDLTSPVKSNLDFKKLDLPISTEVSDKADITWLNSKNKKYEHSFKYWIYLYTVKTRVIRIWRNTVCIFLYPYFCISILLSCCRNTWNIYLMNINLLFFLLKVDHSHYTLLYTPLCPSNVESFHEGYLSLTSSKQNANYQNLPCLYSTDPFTDWYRCLQHGNSSASLIYDSQQDTGIVLSLNKNQGFVSVYSMINSQLNEKVKFSPFQFEFLPEGMSFDPSSHQLYVYGAEVWSSEDGGNTFKKIISLASEKFVKLILCVHKQAVVFVTNYGNIYFSKTGSLRYSKLNKTKSEFSTLYCDHLGNLILLALDAHSPNGLKVENINPASLMMDDDLGFDRPLALQYIRDKTALFHEFGPYLANPSAADSTPKLSNSYIGKLIQLSSGGRGVITEVYTTHISNKFLAVAVVDILETFNGEPLITDPNQSYSLTVRDVSNSSVDIQLYNTDSTDGFQLTDIGKTIVIPGTSSFLITDVVNSNSVIAVSTMPKLVRKDKTYNQAQWMLFNFGSGYERTWRITEGECRHSLQFFGDFDTNSLLYIVIQETMSFSFKASVSESGMSYFQKKLMKVIVGNPSLLKVTAAHSWDTLGNHILNITVFSMFFQKGMTTISVYVPEASLLCSLSSFTFSLQNSCPTSMRIKYIPDRLISADEWQYGNPVDSMGNKLLMDLPVNYRPPSQLGIAIPVSDNIYNADPSKPRPRQYYQISKNTGTYKQCAGKSSQAECGCTEEMRLSPLAAHSDCRKRVLRFLYPVNNFNITLFLTRSGHDNQPLKAPQFVTVTEINNRTNWRITGTNAVPSLLKMREYLGTSLNSTLYNPEGLQISFYGSELFHFRISVIPGISLCDLVEEVQIYIDGPPLAFPAQYLINTITAIVLGGILLIVFLLKLYGVKLPSKSSFTSLFRKRNSVTPIS
ncbi:cation channel sperm-associated protein subunit beta-like [Polyodon spathula]|uniref:cation channel sperm-associated protein subunit beta-like n=1 Tax=Polyodon spathula TaxID=7913 RepID=UPI001B7E257A|nr:cation channel sperm-associated protein subunit beta-like [Polyodon spathula]